MCGEQKLAWTYWQHSEGSPPRVRGTAKCLRDMSQKKRITPACAGNSYSSHQRTPQAQDHPRVCGEQLASKLLMVLFKGSPPRVRGTGAGKSVAYEGAGITPACAGNSCALPKPQRPSRDHPRVCGEQRLNRHRLKRLRGSPPRVRGTVLGAQVGGNAQGITPACAGNRYGHGSNYAVQKDHPRVCGEQISGLCAIWPCLGSPPRVRGTGLLQQAQPPPPGITPACAGNRNSLLVLNVLLEDHPRVCGEQKNFGHICHAE